MINLTEQQFLKLTRKGNLIPVYREILGDMETPVSAYFKLAAGEKYSFLLESVEGEAKVARYSFLAKAPEFIFRIKDNQATVTAYRDKKIVQETGEVNGDPLRFIRGFLKDYRWVPVPGLPRFCGGLVGYFSYDMVRFFERLPQQTRDELRLPDSVLIMAKEIVIFDHLRHTIKIVKCVDVESQAARVDLQKAYRQAVQRIDDVTRQIQGPLPKEKFARQRSSAASSSNFTLAGFKKIVEKAKQQIQAGEIIQVVLSQRFQVKLRTNPFHVYRALRSLNPSPYMYYLNFDDIQIIGSSPELLVRCEEGIVQTRPIAGTRPRGQDEAEDQVLAKDLLADPKEKAEHIMLVDLGRNDLGRVCREGTVQVTEFMNVERYSHVMHIVSNVRGELRPDKDALDVLAATFPAGTVSGAPKIRAMEIIEDLEKVRRGPYAGCVGYFSFSGNLDTCITIRTIVVTQGSAYIQAGAGIVADSLPQREYQETVNKAKAQLAAVKMAQGF
ncbi:MAG: anthranilate synthase component I [Candidatus Omnitrophica bacterium]|nr:anthranilate synthase component I [Candidatus Omnitrophota bacterium]